MNKGMMWVMVVVALVVGFVGGFYFEKSRAAKNVDDVKMAMQKQIDDAKMMGNQAMSPTGMMQSDVVMMAKAGYATDAKGMTLYTYDKDTKNTSNCTGQCAKAWPPYAATSPVPSPLPDHLSVFTRSDATMQYAWDGKPLYYYSGDTKAGDTTGDGVGNVWHLAK
ncbi:MAG: COG4315 family predicted lipoprotein [Candidatus Levyibacteriota bacterium]